MQQQEYDYAPPDPITTSLFKSTDSTISEADIQRILDGDITLPSTLRIAVLNLASTQRNYSYYYSRESYRSLQATYFDTLRSALTASGRTSRVSLLPKLLTGTDPNIFSLRESAVRMQADALLIFSVESNIYAETKIFKSDEIKAYATVEGLLLDIRTGIVVFSSTVSADATGTRLESDTGASDARQRIQAEASLKATGMLAGEVGAFLSE